MTKSVQYENLRNAIGSKSAICKKVKIMQITKSGNLLQEILGINAGEERAFLGTLLNAN